MPLCHFDSFNLWILKPTHLNRGRGIHIFRDLETLHRLIRQYSQGNVVEQAHTKKEDRTPQTEKQANGGETTEQEEQKITAPATKRKGICFNTFVIQKYIERPLLIHKRKFDIRVWVCLSHEQDLFFFEEGYLRTSGYDYTIDLKNIDDAFVHLTNNAV